ncbi:MAG: GntR family transcriptional regulator [Spirochaetales bacterium]
MFLYKQIFEDLKTKILLENFSYGDLLPAERKLEEEYGVDRTTIRKAIQLLVQEGLISKQAGKGSQVIYSPQKSEKVDASKQSDRNIIIFILPESDVDKRITIPFYSELFQSLEIECKNNNFFLIYATLHKDDTLSATFAHIISKIAGIIFVSDINEKHIVEFQSMHIPSVLVNGYSPLLPSILSDNFAGTYRACLYVLEQGHKKIAVLNGCSSHITALERLRGVKTVLKEHNLKLQENYIIGGDSWEYDKAYNHVLHFLESSKELPSAIIAFNDRLAVGAISAIHQSGLKVPDDISVIGFDNSDQAKISYPALTSIDVDISSLANVTFSTLFSQIYFKQTACFQILMPVTLVERDSVKKIQREKK